MSTMRAPNPDHKAPAGFQYFPPPLEPVEPGQRRTPAEEARTLLAHSDVANLATLSEDGTPWASMIMFGTMADGAPVLMVSTLAEHGRNLERDQRGSISVMAPRRGPDPLQNGRVTLAGRFEKPEGERLQAAKQACYDAMMYARTYEKMGDFSVWVLNVERVRWVGGYGVMGSDDAASYRDAAIDPTAPNAEHAVEHLNEDHADALVLIAQKLGGYPDGTAAVCTSIDRFGMDLSIDTPRGKAPARIGFAETCTEPDGLRMATVELARRARTA